MSPKRIALIALLLGIIVLGGAKLFEVKFDSAQTVSTSDAKHLKSTVKIGVDNWAGYYLLCSKHFRSSMRNSGVRSTCENDNANLKTRFEKLRKGQLQFAVATVDAYIALGADYKFPGTIIAVIDESKGGDALVAYENTVATIDDLKGNSALRIALTLDSPSEHLARSLAVHFDVENLKSRGDWLVPANGSEEAAQMLKQQRVDAAVLWEPNVTKALQIDGVKKVIGSEDTKRLIVDILLVNRDFMKNQPEQVKQFLDLYFETLKFYKNSPENLVRELAKETGLNLGEVQSMLKGVKWATLTDNAYDWFSTVKHTGEQEFLIESIESTMDILIETGVMPENPLPDGNPYLITQSQFIAELFETKIGTSNAVKASAQTKLFNTLNDSEWDELREVGTLKVRKINFSRSSSDLSLNAKQRLDEAAKDLAHYPNFRIMVKGHTGLSGDKKANEALSQERSETVLRYLTITHGIDENRLHARGVGSQEPIPRLPNEAKRAYRYRLPRVELILKSGAF